MSFGTTFLVYLCLSASALNVAYANNTIHQSAQLVIADMVIVGKPSGWNVNQGESYQGDRYDDQRNYDDQQKAYLKAEKNLSVLVLEDITLVVKRPDRGFKFEANDSISPTEYKVLSLSKVFKEHQGIEINFDIDFANNSKVLTANGRSVIDVLASAMNFIGKDYQFEIRGYTDSTGSSVSKQRLSEARAQTVATLLQNNHQINNDISYAGFADVNPIASNQTRDGRSENARITIINRGNQGQYALK